MTTTRGANTSFRLSDLDLQDPHDVARAAQGVLAGREEFRRPYDRRFYANSRFLEGGWRQWCKYEGDDFKLSSALKGKQLLTANITLEIVESLISRLMPPGNSLEADPITDDREDINKSRLLTDVLNYYHGHIQMEVVLIQFLLTMCCSPIVWLTGGWSATRGPLVRTSWDDFLATQIEEAFPYGIDRADDAERRVVIKRAASDFAKLFGKRALEKREIVQHAGELFADVVTIPQMSWWPWDSESTKWEPDIVVHTQVLPYETIAEREGLTVDEVRQRCTGRLNQRYLNSSSDRYSYLSSSYGLRASSSRNDMEMGEYHQFFRRPCVDYPEGVEGVVLGSDFTEAVRVNEEGIDNYNHVIPFFPAVQHSLTRGPLGTCVVDQIKTQQIDLNRALQSATYRRELYSSPPILIDEQGIVDQNEWTLKLAPGIQHKYRGQAPKLMELPNVNIGDETAIERDIAHMRQLSSVTSLAVGEADSAGVKSGRAINSLEEKTEQRLVPPQKRIIVNQTEFWQFQAEEVIHKPVGDQIAQITGRYNNRETIDWSSEELRPSTYGTPNRRVALIRIAPFSNLPMNGVERRNFVMGLVKSEILIPKANPKDREEAMRLLGIGEHRNGLEQNRVDEASARWETRQWSMGLPVEPPIEEENHEVHIRIAEEWMRTTEYRAVIRDVDGMEAHIAQHLRTHRRLALIRMIRPRLEQPIAMAEAWQLVNREAEMDFRTGVMDPEIFKLLPAGTPPGQPSILLDFGSLFGQPVEPGVGAPQGSEQPPSQPQAPQQGGDGREFVGEEGGRDTRRDLSDAGVDRNHLFAQQ